MMFNDKVSTILVWMWISVIWLCVALNDIVMTVIKIWKLTAVLLYTMILVIETASKTKSFNDTKNHYINLLFL